MLFCGPSNRGEGQERDRVVSHPPQDKEGGPGQASEPGIRATGARLTPAAGALGTAPSTGQRTHSGRAGGGDGVI